MTENLERQFEARREQESMFTKENWMIRVNNELHSRYEPLEEGVENLSEEDRNILKEASEYYEQAGDTLSVIRLALKTGDIEEAEKIAEEFMEQDETGDNFSRYGGKSQDISEANLIKLQKAYVIRDLAAVKNDDELKEKAIEMFEEYAQEMSKNDKLFSLEASAVVFAEARKLTSGKEKENLSQSALDQFEMVIKNRAAAGDRWWESIAIRQVAKISKNPEDKKKRSKDQKSL